MNQMVPAAILVAIIWIVFFFWWVADHRRCKAAAEARAKAKAAAEARAKAKAKDLHEVLSSVHTVLSSAGVKLWGDEISFMTGTRGSSPDRDSVRALRRLVKAIRSNLGEEAAAEIDTKTDPDAPAGILRGK